MRTRFSDLFGLDYPIMSAPMALHSGGTLAGAVSAAGALGSFGGIHRTEGPDWVRREIDIARNLTDRPFAVGFITPFLEFTEPYFAAALAAAPAAVVFSFSDPGAWVNRARDAGAKTICQIQTDEHAAQAVDCGADALIAQGNAAGGHTGASNLLPLLSRTISRYPDIPVLAAGGIADARSLAAVLMAGADGACIGTAFLATPEAVEVGDAYKNAIVASDGSDTIFTRTHDIASGMPWPAEIGERIRRDAFTDEWADREAELTALAQIGTAPTPKSEPMYYGEAAGAVGSIRPAADIVQTLVADAEAFIAQRSSTLLA